jgi:glycosyltransferase involved in cell wall biosynthesis
MISIVMPVHNQQDIIQSVLQGIWDNSSSNVKEIIIIIDGCTDCSEKAIMDFMDSHHSTIRTVVLYTDDLNEVKADNVGLKAATQPYVVLNQDDCIPDEKYWDARLLQPFMVWDDVFAVTGRMSLDTFLKDGNLDFYNGTSWTNLDRHTFAVRDVVNRGPLMMRKYMLEELGYLDEAYAPLFMDDVDIATRAWIHNKWVSGAFPITFKSDLNWGTTRKSPNPRYGLWERDHMALFVHRYHDYIIGPKHSQNRNILE